MTEFKHLIKYFSFAFIPFLIFLGVTLFSYFYLKRAEEERLRSQFNFKTSQAEELIKRRTSHYIQVLKGAKALFTASTEINRREWKNYIEALEVSKNYPGIQGIGYVKAVSPENLKNHIQEIRAEGFPAYTVKPGGNRPFYTIIVFLEPFTGR